ncbi:MAG: Fic family protein [Phormidesmis sp.]
MVPAVQRAPQEAGNSYRQVLRLEEMIQEAIGAGRFHLKVSTLMELNSLAVDGLVESPGRYRLGPIEIEHSKHEPPSPNEVARYVDELCEYVNENWELEPLHLSAYTMWMICWIHPFEDGNGRTARAASYLVLCARLGRLLPGDRTIPVQLVDDKEPYYRALESGDEAFARGKVDVKKLERLLDRLLVSQVRDAATSRLSGRNTIAPAEQSAPVKVRKGQASNTAAWIGAGGIVLAAIIGSLAKCPTESTAQDSQRNDGEEGKGTPDTPAISGSEG